MNKYKIIYLILLFISWNGITLASSTDSIKIISYNVENLFDYQHDSLKNDSSFLPEGIYHWTYYKYQTKLDHIAQVVVNIAGWESVPLVGLCEVENNCCLDDLCYRLKRFHYRYLHYESADERGVDVALLYDSTKVNILNSKPLQINLPNDYTRDILYACCLLNNSDTIHTMVCHLPSQLGGYSNTEYKRQIAKQRIQDQIDSIFTTSSNAEIVVMGDMNTSPLNDLEGMYNLMLLFQKSGQGTHKYHGIWSCLDQFYVSQSLHKKSIVSIFSPDWLLEEDNQYLDKRPHRTHIGYKYHNGYSDHLPIILTITK
ncbi:MAG: hypothetical protein IIU55_01445 [Paludibacteraceae bacterium]|jgi:hypothetical protein|nr:hypothetical protein [Paludibacteraceae bacterium]